MDLKKPRLPQLLPPLKPFKPEANNTEKKEKVKKKRSSGFYSEIETLYKNENECQFKENAFSQRKLLWVAFTHKYMPNVKSFNINPALINEKVTYFLDKAKLDALPETDFLECSYEPKVQLPYLVSPKTCPREVEILRRKKQFQSLKLENLLLELNIPIEHIMPKSDSKLAVDCETSFSNIESTDSTPFPFFLDIELFDNTEYDCRNASEWVNMGKTMVEEKVINERYKKMEESQYETPKTKFSNALAAIRLLMIPKLKVICKPVPGVALLPVMDEHRDLDPRMPEITYKWVDVGMLTYDFQNKLYLVQKVDCNGRVLDQSGMSTMLDVNPELRHKGPLMSSQYWVPRIRLMFKAENPQVFAKRVAEAYMHRKKTEGLLRCQLYVDCMPVEDMLKLDDAVIKRIVESAIRSPAHFKDKKSLEDLLLVLTTELQLDYQRTMNNIIFKVFTYEKPEIYSFVTKPNCHLPKVRYEGCVPIPKHPFNENLKAFRFHTLLVRPEVAVAISKVKGECIKLTTMTLFNTTTMRPMKIEEFEQVQSQMSSHVSLFMRDSWIGSLRAVIRTALRDLGKGWFNLYERNWAIYQISKMKRFMEMVKFYMQDALRYLVQDSLSVFVQMVVDACHSTLQLPETYVWSGDALVSPFKPRRNALLTLEINIENGEVMLSYPLNQVATLFVSLFNKAIVSVQNIPQLEKLVLEEILFPDSTYLEAVGLKEPPIEDLRNSLVCVIKKATIPMNAYIELYRKYVTLSQIDSTAYIKDLETRKIPPVELKELVEMYENSVETVKQTLPSFIVIGMFYLTVDNLKQKIMKKCKQLAGVTLDLLAKVLRKQADDACEEYKVISRALYEKAPTIEALVEKRKWIKTIPAKLEEFSGVARKAMDDYELIEGFNFNLSNEDFNIKYNTIGWPHKIMIQIEHTLELLAEDEEKFRKFQVSDQAQFNERIDLLSLNVSNIPGLSDISKAHEYANQCRRLFKELKEAQQDAAKYNSREKLFNMPITIYDKVPLLLQEFEPFRLLWITTSDWLRWHYSWMNDDLFLLDGEAVEKNVNESYKTISRCCKIFSEVEEVGVVANTVKKMIEDFKPHIGLIQGLRNPGMKQRHWDMLAEGTGITLNFKTGLTFAKCLELKLQDHVQEIMRVADIASKEYSIERVLDKITAGWENVVFELVDYKNSGRHIISVSDEVGQQMDDHIVAIQALSFSPYKKPFQSQIVKWEGKLKLCQEVLDLWMKVQRQWLYLEPIFSSEDIVKQLPVENKRFQTVERAWKKIMKNVVEDPKVISICADVSLLASLTECHNILEQVEKGLSDYLETKRTAFPRFFFLSDDELLEILSQTTDPTAVQPHLKKCFENINLVTFEEDLSIVEMISADGEVVNFSRAFKPEGNVEEWMGVMENEMMSSLKELLRKCLDHYLTVEREKWILSGWPGQLVLAGSQCYWAADVSQALQDCDLEEFFLKVLRQLDRLRKMMSESELTPMQRKIMSDLIVIEVHARDVVATMVKQKVREVTDFEWISQLRYYWEEDDFWVKAVNSRFPYGFEYLGNSGRLVITPLTDRCYLTLTGALHLKFGGAPAGPAGTGKTETTKDLAKFMAKKCVVFNCSDQLDFLAMAKFFKGLASSGSWACLDEFNRIDVEVLSVVAQQITTIQTAQQQKASLFMFEGVQMVLKASCAIFITMNPGYAGRTELPDNLKALFRPVAMMVPDYAMITEISLFSFGFSNAKNLAKKIVMTFKLSSEQLSSQDHYDFGMRAVKSVISATENLKRVDANKDEGLLVLRALKNVNLPKFLTEDLILFKGIVSDLFPNAVEEEIDYGIFFETLKETCIQKSLRPVEGFINKCIQLYETTIVRHGLMLLGPAGSGKTKCYEVLMETQSALKGKSCPDGNIFENTQVFIINPKAISMGQLYGQYDINTHEWTDGILSTIVRVGVSANDNDKKWYMFDGPVDAVWCESMNTVLDDNKKLCLTSGEIIKLTDSMVMMFEVENLAVASPATVSRCGMIYLESSVIGSRTLVDCWIGSLHANLEGLKPRLTQLFNFYLEQAVSFVRHKCKEMVATTDMSLVSSTIKILDSLLRPFKSKDKQPVKFMNPTVVTESVKKKLLYVIDAWFAFSVVWGFGGALTRDYRNKFDLWCRKTYQKYNLHPAYPADGIVYDYYLDDNGLTVNVSEEVDDENTNWDVTKITWKNWVKKQEFNAIPGTMFSDFIVPTIDTIRSTELLNLLISNNNPVLCVGPTGTGKTVTVCNKLTRNMPEDFFLEFIYFSAKTTASQTQRLIDSKLDKRRKGVFGPPVGKHLLLFIDDFNMPALETYGAQPAIELIRQFMDFNGWYDSQTVGEFRKLLDMTIIGAMGLPGGGRNVLTSRLQRHFNIISFVEMGRTSKQTIFRVIYGMWKGMPQFMLDFCDKVVNSSLDIYEKLLTSLLPTPNKSHYTFNLRDLSKIFQGMLMCSGFRLKKQDDLLKLWYHEHQRVYADRLVCIEDRTWFEKLCKEQANSHFHVRLKYSTSPVLYFHQGTGVSMNENYTEITNYNELHKWLKSLLEDYNQINVKKLNLVLFEDAVSHLCRIIRIIMQPLGNALLLGVGGSGRTSLTKLACHQCEFEMFQIELSKNYNFNEWKEDMKKVCMTAGVNKITLVFFFSDTQIKEETFLEDVCSLLSSGNVPNLFSDDELEMVYNNVKPAVLEANLLPTKTNMFSMFTKNIKSHLHLVLSMSPMGKTFRSRLRQFPALINNCTIDWFEEWPDNALESVAREFVEGMPIFQTKSENNFSDLTTRNEAAKKVRIFDAESIRGNPSEKKTEIKNEGIENDNESKTLQTLEENEMYSIDKANRAQNSIIIFEQVRSKSFFFKNHTIKMFKSMHVSVVHMSARYFQNLNRHTYITPTFYLELLELFKILYEKKSQQLVSSYERTKTGVDKLLAASEDVGVLSLELARMQPLLEEATQVAIETVNKITEDTKVAEETKMKVMIEESEADIKAKATQTIAEDAENDLLEALPALDSALASLKTLNKIDIVEVRALQRPPDGVKMVIEAVCIMKNVKPKKIMDDKGGKKDDYWDVGKSLLVEPQKFLDSLFLYDRDNISEATIKAIQPYIDNEAFQPSAISKVSKACTSICQWVRAMYKYHFVAKSVAPKREALRMAQEDLAKTQRSLSAAKEKLQSVVGGIALLQKQYEECAAKKEELDAKAHECEAKLKRADKLIGGLADEKSRWNDLTKELETTLENLIGDIFIAAGYVAYMGAFTSEYRAELFKEWLEYLKVDSIPYNQSCIGLVETLCDQVLLRQWQINGLPKDILSTENAVIVQNSRKWPLLIDPQEQANKWIKNMEGTNGLKVVKIADKDFQRNVENSIRFGKPCLLENVEEDLDPALEPVLLKQIFKQDGNMVLKLGDAVIPYHDDFKFYMTTKLPNPHYNPEISAKVTLINFTLSISGLEGQLLAKVVAEERPDLEDAKNQLILNSSKLRKELNEIEDKILFKLNSSEGNPLDDEEFIQTLEASKLKFSDIKAKVVVAEQTEREIDETRSQYIPVAVNTRIMFFSVTALVALDPMYQYSLEWLINLFISSVRSAKSSDQVKKRCISINNYFTFNLYCNVCRSLFEKDKLLFAFLLSIEIMKDQSLIDKDEYRFLLSGVTGKKDNEDNLKKPPADWLSVRSWYQILELSMLPAFKNLASDVTSKVDDFKLLFDHLEPHRAKLPSPWQEDLSPFQKILLIKCLRADKIPSAMQDFIANNLGQQFIEPQTADLNVVFKDSSPTCPLVFILSQGTDPAVDLYKFAEEMRFSKKLNSISLGQGQGPRAELIMLDAMEKGLWVFFQNCHLAPSWIASLEKIIANIQIENVHKDFRLWLTSMPSPHFPAFILQNSAKMTVEPPRGIKANLLKSYSAFSDDYFKVEVESNFKYLLYSLCMFHAVILERRKFGSLGFNIGYEFTDGDLRICVSQLKMFLEEYEEVPYKVLTYTAGEINYGGRVTDDWDRRTMSHLIGDYYNDKVLSNLHIFSEDYRQITDVFDKAETLQHIKELPLNDSSQMFGLHDNANVTYAQNEAFKLLASLLLLQPKETAVGSLSREEVVESKAKEIQSFVPKEISLEMVSAKYPVVYEQSMNTVLVQEVVRYNKLLAVMKWSLTDLFKALTGKVIMSTELELMVDSIFDNKVPEKWSAKAYPSLKPLSSWVSDLKERIAFLQNWIDNGTPDVFWLSGFFFPQAFLTGVLQNYARQNVVAIDTISFEFQVMRQSANELPAPSRGCYIRGLFMEGAKWDLSKFRLDESRSKELYTTVPCIWLKPTLDRKIPFSGIYECPVYKTLKRAGTLSTTGHSTNFVFAIELPTNKHSSHWIKRGVAMLCALDY